MQYIGGDGYDLEKYKLLFAHVGGSVGRAYGDYAGKYARLKLEGSAFFFECRKAW